MASIQEIAVDVTRSLLADPRNGHNRLHPAIPPVAVVEPGETIRVDLRDGFDAQITRASTPADLARLDFVRGHSLTGPIAVDGVRPGDALEVEICGIEPAGWGYTAIVPGIGLLGDRFQRPFLVHWDISEGVARSAQIPGVSIPGRPFLGVVAVAPSEAFLDAVISREQALASSGELVMLPDPTSAQPADGEPARRGLRTLPPRENGGNLDVRHLTAGSRVCFTAQVERGLCSLGDPHFAQGDGESCGLAIETSATATLRFHVRESRPPSSSRMPILSFTSSSPPGRPYVATTGIPVDSDGNNTYLDVYAAARRALSELVDAVSERYGLTAEQAYVVASVAADLQISEIVNVPNPLVCAALPLDIFDAAVEGRRPSYGRRGGAGP